MCIMFLVATCYRVFISLTAFCFILCSCNHIILARPWAKCCLCVSRFFLFLLSFYLENHLVLNLKKCYVNKIYHYYYYNYYNISPNTVNVVVIVNDPCLPLTGSHCLLHLLHGIPNIFV